MNPVIRIGKAGVTVNQVMEIKKLLRKRKSIKIKFLKSFIYSKDKKEEAKNLAEKTGSVLIAQIGNVVVLHKK